eukprot:4603892-Lingulodinium_polyedra.AAC.1
MVHSPLGPAIAVAAGRYLGAWLVRAARAALAEARGGSRRPLKALPSSPGARLRRSSPTGGH